MTRRGEKYEIRRRIELYGRVVSNYSMKSYGCPNLLWQKLKPPYTSSGRPDPHSDRSGQEQTTLMKPYKGYFITSSAMPVHPFNRTGTLAAAFWCRVAVVQSWEITRFQLGVTVSIKELAEWFGLEVARIVVDECVIAWVVVLGKPTLHRQRPVLLSQDLIDNSLIERLNSALLSFRERDNYRG